MVNSFDAIRSGDNRRSLVQILITRKAAAEGLIGEGWTEQPVQDVEVVDNGVGFTTDNFGSFNSADSMHKIAIGGKGLGRFSYLKAFASVEVVSVFRDGDKTRRRTFRFRPTAKGVETMRVEDVPESTALRTSVKMCSALPEAKFPRSMDVFARQIVEECMEHFILKDCARVTLVDSSEKIDLIDFCEKQVVVESQQEEIKVGKKKFTIRHILALSPNDSNHRIRLCANRRQVESESLHERVPEPNGPICRPTDVRPVVYSVYVSGSYLDNSVNEHRLAFDFDKADELFDGVTYDRLLGEITARVRAYLKPIIDPIREQTLKKHQTFIDSKAPWFKPILSRRPDEVAAVPTTLPEPKRNLEYQRILNEIQADSEKGVRDAVGRLLTSLGPEEHATYDRFLESFSQYTEVGQADLARYVAHRRAVLELLRSSIKPSPDGSLPLEKTIHDIIFPRKRTNEDLSVGAANLWLVDDRLAFFHYLASDIPFDQNAAVEVDSKRRPDLIAFDNPIAYTQGDPPFDSVTILEFKRPVKEGYSEKDNPINQIVDYVELIRSGKAKSPEGRPIEVSPDTRYFGYVICDPADKISQFVKYRKMNKAVDGHGYWDFDPELNLHMEVIYFSKLLRDAMRRNAAFFRQLGIPCD